MLVLILKDLHNEAKYVTKCMHITYILGDLVIADNGHFRTSFIPGCGRTAT
jgi:hypothetical protein